MKHSSFDTGRSWRRAGALALILSAILSGGQAVAGEEALTSISPRALAGILAKERVIAGLTTTEGDTTLYLPTPESWPAPEAPVEVFFYECDGGPFLGPARAESACLSYEYRAYAPASAIPDNPDIANRWNKNYHFGKAWRDDLGDVWIQMNVIVAGGVTERNIRESYKLWRRTLSAFSEYLKAKDQ